MNPTRSRAPTGYNTSMVALTDIEDYARRVVERFAPQRIILFGSFADGTPTEDSDVDLLVVMPVEGNPIDKAAEIRRALGHAGFPLDLIVRDPDDLAWRLEQHDWFLLEIMQKGQVLHETADAGMG